MEENLLSVGIDTGAASPQTGQPVWGPHVMFASSAEVNSACTKVLAFGQNTCTAQKRRGPEGRFSEMLYLFRMHMPS